MIQLQKTPKMASTLCHKWCFFWILFSFCEKPQHFFFGVSVFCFVLFCFRTIQFGLYNLISMLAFATATRKSFNDTFTAKIIFLSCILCYHYWYWHCTEGLTSLHTLFDTYLNRMLVKFERHRLTYYNYWSYYVKVTNLIFFHKFALHKNW